MKIIELQVEGYRSLKSQSWRPGDLNVLIGPNASGKSNLLRALELLSTAARGGLGRFIQQEGGIVPLLWDGQATQIRLGVEFVPHPSPNATAPESVAYEILLEELGFLSVYRIANELLVSFPRDESGAPSAPFTLLERRPNHAAVYSTVSKRLETLPQPSAVLPLPAPAPTAPTRTSNPLLSILQQMAGPPERILEDEALLPIVAGPFAANQLLTVFQQELAAWTIHHSFQTHREAPIRTAQVTRAETRVSPDGQNLISVLHTLYTGNRDFKREINEAMQAAFGDDFEELVFPPAADQRIQLRIRWRSLQREQSAADLSDGTLRFLFLLAVLANPSPPPLVAIDEPETGLHPSMFPIVAEYAREAATRCQVIFTTHSPEFLDGFGRQPPTTTVVERQEGQSVLRVLSGDELSYWLTQYTLGELYRSRELETIP